MTQAIATQISPYAVEVTAGQEYYWCACGRSATQPFCDGSHEGTELQPVPFTAKRSETVYLCGCRATASAPFCDGSHND